jgi:hypothetical protein
VNGHLQRMAGRAAVQQVLPLHARCSGVRPPPCGGTAGRRRCHRGRSTSAGSTG